jgi:hypothetical protein
MASSSSASGIRARPLPAKNLAAGSEQNRLCLRWPFLPVILTSGQPPRAPPCWAAASAAAHALRWLAVAPADSRNSSRKESCGQNGGGGFRRPLPVSSQRPVASVEGRPCVHGLGGNPRNRGKAQGVLDRLLTQSGGMQCGYLGRSIDRSAFWRPDCSGPQSHNSICCPVFGVRHPDYCSHSSSEGREPSISPPSGCRQSAFRWQMMK